MNNGYSIDLRERVVAYIEQGGSKAEASKLFQVSRRTIYYWLERKAQSGHLAPNKMKPYKTRKLDTAKLLEHVELNADATLEEMAEHFEVSLTTIWYALKRMKVTRKKNRTLQRASGRKTAEIPSGDFDIISGADCVSG